MKQFLLSIVFILSSVIAYGNPDTLWTEANAAYQAKDYTKAIEKYESILASSNYSDELHYNLGNSYYKNKQMGHAILNYERALVLSPRDADIQHNLNLARLELEDDIEELPPFFLSKWWKTMHQSASSTLWSCLSILFLIFGVGGIALWLLGADRVRKKQGFVGGIALILLSLLFLGLARSQGAKERDSQTAIVMKKEIALRSGPEADSKEILKLHEGTKVALMDKIGEWYKIRLANGEQGWLEMTSMEKI